MQKQVLATQEEVHFTTQQLSEALQMQRSNLSKLLNELAKENRVKKTNGRPVYYSLVKEKDQSCFQTMIGSDGSLKQTVQLIKAALMYPGHSLPLLITGPDGSGKSLLAKLIYEYAKENHGDLKNFGVFAFVASLQKQGMRIIVKNENEILTIKQKSKFKSFIFS